jgi:ABC-type transport system substrate-binding protein/DNA-binding SARP family transcriptional activator/streptogramin lyase
MHPIFRILGPLEVESSERVVALGRRERALLGVLLLNAGEAVSVERLIDGVWGEVPPASAKHMVHEYVSRLRTAVGDASRIQTRVPGYLVTCSDEELDALLFSRLTAAARTAAAADDHADALRSYEQALALWRGDALAGVELEGDAQIDVARLDLERRVVAEERLDSALALGRHAQLIPELERRVRDEPLSERSRAQLMLALYRAGRQIDALQRYRDGRALLVDHAGVEPGPELRGLERAILTQDPALDLAPAVRTDAATASAPQAHRRWTRRGGATALLLAGVVGALIIVGHSGSAHALARIDASSAGAIDPGTNRLVDQVRVGAGPGRIAAGFGSLWVVNDFDSTVARVDPASGNVQTIQVDSDPTAIAVGGGFVWVASTGTRSVDRIDPQLNRRTQRTPVGNGPSGIAISPGVIWVTNRLDDTVTEVDSKNGTVRRTLNAGPSPSDIAYGLGALWIANESSSSVTRLDPATGGLQQIPVGNGPAGVAVGYGSIWVANSLDGTVSRINPNSHVVTSFAVGSGPSSVLASDGAIWVADSYGGRIDRIDPATNHVVHTIAVGSGPQSLASSGGRIWLSARETAAVHRGGTLRLFDWRGHDSLDVGVGYSPTSWSLFAVSGDGLVGFKRVGGLDGGTLVPDLAASLPGPADSGRIYTFQLRHGIRYSNGDRVRASDLRRALERVFRLGSPRLDLYAGLVGASACSKARCDLSRGVVADDRKQTVTLHLRKPDPEFLYKLAIPFAYLVPREVSMTKPARLGVPGTGPYMIQSYTDSRVVLVRNQHFRQWSAAAQPNGYPDRIELTYNADFGKQLTAVEQGKADLMQSFPVSRLNEITTRYAAQVHVFGRSQTAAIFLNTREPPFDNLAARQAFNYAIDRGKIVTGYGGVDGAAVTCQILPAGMPGYRPYCPYTRDPSANGIWTGPDLARGRKLVAASHTQGQKVVVWAPTKPFQIAAGKEAVATLNRLGYGASLKLVSSDVYFAKVADSRTHAQAGFAAWSQDYPAASNFLTLFTCGAFQPASANNNNNPEICDRHLDRAVNRALTQQSSGAHQASNESWAALDRLVTNLAPWVPIVNPREVVVVSRRVGNVQSNTQWGVLIDQLWVK